MSDREIPTAWKVVGIVLGALILCGAVGVWVWWAGVRGTPAEGGAITLVLIILIPAVVIFLGIGGILLPSIASSSRPAWSQGPLVGFLTLAIIAELAVLGLLVPSIVRDAVESGGSVDPVAGTLLLLLGFVFASTAWSLKRVLRDDE